MKAPQILVFDSGLGGLSITACLLEKMPGICLTYVADNAFFPYGEQPEDIITARILLLIEAALQQTPVDLVVLGCNTASTLVLPALRARIAQQVVGVVPAVKPAAAITRNRRIGILATPATVQRPYLDDLIQDFAGHCQVTRVGNSDLVRMAESSLYGVAVDQARVAAIVAPFVAAGIDTLVLGCTHFPLIRAQLQQALGEQVICVDSGEAIALRARHLLQAQGFFDQAGKPLYALPAVDTLYTAGEMREESARMAALFTGEAPAGLQDYARRMGIGRLSIRADWQPEPL